MHLLYNLILLLLIKKLNREWSLFHFLLLSFSSLPLAEMENERELHPTLCQWLVPGKPVQQISDQHLPVRYTGPTVGAAPSHMMVAKQPPVAFA